MCASLRRPLRPVPACLFVFFATLCWATATPAVALAAAPVAQVEIPTDADVTLDSLHSGVNYGTSTRLIVGHGTAREGDQRALLHFNLAGLLPTGAVIDSAQLHLYLMDATGTDPVTITPYLVTAAWTESGVTWSSQPAVTTAGGSQSIAAAPGEKTWDVTGIAQAAQSGGSFSLLLMGPEGTAASYTRGFLSREYNEIVPHLFVTYRTAADTTPPTNPVLTAGRPINTWSNSPTIFIGWSGASDGQGSGVYGYSVEWATSFGVLPDTTVDTTHTAGGLTTIPADGKSWYFAIRTRDNAGNWAPDAASIGPFWLDTVPPANPPYITGSPPPGAWNNFDNSLSLSWDNGADNAGGSGVAGYSMHFSQSASDRPDNVIDTTWNTDGSGLLADGQWYFHLITADRAGNWSTLETGLGPFRIDLTPPSSYTGSGNHETTPVATNSFVVSVTGLDATSGVKAIAVQVQDLTVKQGWTDWKLDAQHGGAYTFDGAPGHLYCFRTRATDNAGNAESWPAQVDQCIAVATVDFIADKVLLTQGIQNYQGDATWLIAGRRTVARCFVHAESGNFAGVSALLTVRDHNGAQVGQLKPLNPPDGRMIVWQNPYREFLSESFYFEIPVGWFTVAGVTFSCDVNPDIKYYEKNYENNRALLTASAQPPPPVMELTLVDVPYFANGVIHWPALWNFWMLHSYLMRAYPITDLNLSSGYFSAYPSLPESSKVNNALRYHKVVNVLYNGEPYYRRWYGMVADSGGFMRGRGDMPGLVASGPTGPGDWDNDGSYGDWYAAHELGHNYGRSHVLCQGDEGGPDPGYPHPGGLISTKTDPEDPAAWYGLDFQGMKLLGPTWTDTMSYCDYEWPSDYTTKGILAAMRAEAAQAGAVTATAAAPAEHLLVQAEVSPTDTITLTAFMRIPNSFDALGRTPGDYSVRLLGAGGATLADYPVSVHFDPPDEPSSFGAMVPWVAGTQQVAIYHGARLLGGRTVSAHAPSVTLLSPNGGERLTGESAEVRWQASDPDGDPLTFTLDYSLDSGAHWQGLAFDLTGSQTSLLLPRLPGSGHARLRIWASDGVNTGTDSSDGDFSAPAKPPRVGILSPQSGIRVAAGQLVTFEGAATDPEDGGLIGDALQWTSDLVGPLGSGSLLQTNTLIAGFHTITLTATDRAGQSTSAHTIVRVGVEVVYLPVLRR